MSVAIICRNSRAAALYGTLHATLKLLMQNLLHCKVLSMLDCMPLRNYRVAEVWQCCAMVCVGTQRHTPHTMFITKHHTQHG